MSIVFDDVPSKQPAFDRRCESAGQALSTTMVEKALRQVWNQLDPYMFVPWMKLMLLVQEGSVHEQ